MERDPVCSMPLATAEHAGRSYYFCSGICRQKFIADPQRYITRATGMRLTVGVMGSASADYSEAAGTLAVNATRIYHSYPGEHRSTADEVPSPLVGEGQERGRLHGCI